MTNRPTSEDLADQITRLTDEVVVLRESVDELKTSFEWAIRNARITLAFDDVAKDVPTATAIAMFEIGDAVTFYSRGDDVFGEIVDLNDGENVAMVQLIPSNAFVTVEQDYLTRVEDDPLSYREEHTEQSRPERPPPLQPPAAPGELF